MLKTKLKSSAIVAKKKLSTFKKKLIELDELMESDEMKDKLFGKSKKNMHILKLYELL